MLNGIWIGMVLVALFCGALSGNMQAVSKASSDYAKSAVELAIGLVGVMTFWMGAMAVVQRAGAARWIANKLMPLMQRLFPEVPPDHPAMSAMLMNFVANMLGLGNAATPFGLKAMIELDKLNQEKGTATNAMALFLAINTSGLGLLPTGVIALRSSAGSASPGAVFLPTIVATLIAAVLAVFACRFLQRFSPMGPAAGGAGVAVAPRDVDMRDAEAAVAVAPPSVGGWRQVAVLAVSVLLGALAIFNVIETALGTPEILVPLKTALRGQVMPGVGWLGALKAAASYWPLPMLIIVVLGAGMLKEIKVYDTIVEVGKDGFQTALRIIPYLVAMQVAIGMLRESGALGLFVSALEPVTSLVGMPAEAVPMLLLRPLSGSGTFALISDAMKQYGPDSFIGLAVSTMYGSTETTFYVLAVYFGVVGTKRIRHTLLACLIADFGGMIAAVWAVRLFT
jgi:spore maturation protein SpmA